MSLLASESIQSMNVSAPSALILTSETALPSASVNGAFGLTASSEYVLIIFSSASMSMQVSTFDTCSVGEGVSLASGLSPVPHAHSESTITQAKSRAMSFFICFPLFHRFVQKIKPPPKQPLRRGIPPAAKACFGKRLVHRFLNYVSLLDILPYMHIHCNTKLAPPICSAALLRSFHKVL